MIRFHYTDSLVAPPANAPAWARRLFEASRGKGGRQCAVYSTESLDDLKDWLDENRVPWKWISLTPTYHMPHVLLFGAGLNKACAVEDEASVDAETYRADQRAWAAPLHGDRRAAERSV